MPVDPHIAPLLDLLASVPPMHAGSPEAAREAFRRETYVSLAATGLVSGFGAQSYVLAIEAAAGQSA